jgi:lia operon protein LiaG
MSRLLRISGTATLLFLLPALLGAQERYAIGGSHVAVFNIAGEVQVRGTTGGQVTVEVERGGRAGDDLRVELGEVGGRQTLRVVYPSDRIVYGGRGWSGSTQLRVQPDGTWGGERTSLLRRGRAVTVVGRGRGSEAHANLRIAVPRGQRVDIHLAVGSITAENVDGQVRLDTHAGGVTARQMAGHLTIDTGSGAVEVAGMQGDLLIDTGSGRVRVTDIAGDRVSIDTGSGSVVAEGIAADRLLIDTGSGGIAVRRGSGRDIRLDTGSGSVNAELSGALDRLVIDTGSGSVTLALPHDVDASLVVDTGSGRIDVGLPLSITRQARNELRGVLGAGRGTIRIDTGSGSVRVRPL